MIENRNILDKLSRIFIFALSILSLQSCSQNSDKEEKGNPKIKFEHLEFDFGNIEMGEQVSHRFIYKNAGTGNLKIENVIVSCGCTLVNYDKNPIAEGKESFIEVSFNSDGYRGLQKKDVEVYSSCDSSKTVLTLWTSINDNE
jgi:hypothetical protein